MAASKAYVTIHKRNSPFYISAKKFSFNLMDKKGFQSVELNILKGFIYIKYIIYRETEAI